MDQTTLGAWRSRITVLIHKGIGTCLRALPVLTCLRVLFVLTYLSVADVSGIVPVNAKENSLRSIQHGRLGSTDIFGIGLISSSN